MFKFIAALTLFSLAVVVAVLHVAGVMYVLEQAMSYSWVIIIGITAAALALYLILGMIFYLVVVSN